MFSNLKLFEHQHEAQMVSDFGFQSFGVGLLNH
jgi:hypothetical protein